MEQRQAFENLSDKPIYVSVEPWPECFELEPGEKLVLIWTSDLPNPGTIVDILDAENLVVWPGGDPVEVNALIDDKPANDRSWNFKHR